MSMDSRTTGRTGLLSFRITYDFTTQSCSQSSGTAFYNATAYSIMKSRLTNATPGAGSTTSKPVLRLRWIGCAGIRLSLLTLKDCLDPRGVYLRQFASALQQW